MTRHRIALGAALLAAGACALLLLAPRPLGQEQRLPAPQHLSAAARTLLKTRMAHHGEDMRELQSAVLRIDYPRIGRAARSVASEPSLARPLSGDATELNAQLPERFFRLQDELKANADRLARAADARDPNEVADGYGRLARTCVACHQVYLYEPKQQPVQ